ncbi:1-acyl-sn-glycerol-3-phosphate acyltransferase [Cricetibacter osteomyelitidis]|uniref:1-acyl-sn-glycerol-3-phosphate acyltransferase n=1 Tax=Cricetibacter osteomyelitidis TaxID=1521931 RepID=A0A4R2T024_9PAST|nr:lysophospholipid acyltransferase family protein [Cricetibacter osteomyelitidis]TCP95185.1 1-acyl-sn-glycerol-3-phosphate acyltransferase [Cricetibacter osteomyelitidis]
MQNWLARFFDFLLCRFIIFLTGVKPQKQLCKITDFSPKVFYSNHSSHGDFMLLWVSMPYELRQTIRPVAAKDYWDKGIVRRFLAYQVFNLLLIERKSDHPQAAIEQMSEALKTHSLIIFPEGTRKTDDDLSLQPFRKGLYYLAKQNPDVPLIPIWINNINNVLPKGYMLPIPLLCELFVGETQYFTQDEPAVFLQKMEQALLALNPKLEKE